MSPYGTRQLVDGIRAVRQETLRTAEDIPESDYGFRPTPESRSVGETLVHIAWLWSFQRYVHQEAHLDTLEGFDFPGLMETSRAEERRPRSKAEIVELLRTEGERFADWVRQLPESLLAEPIGMPGGGSVSRFELLIMAARDHEVHHAAQLTVLERLLGRVPHATRAMQG